MSTIKGGFPDVVVTGMAMTTSLGADAESTWRALLNGESGIRTLDDPFVDEFELPVRIGGHLLEDFDAHLSSADLDRLSYVQRMATMLGRRVWEHAGSPDVDTRRLLVSIGTGVGGLEKLAFAYDDLYARRPEAVSAQTVWQYAPNGPAAAVALERRAHAGVFAPTSACAWGPRAWSRRGGTSWRATPTSPSAEASNRRSRRCRSPPSPRCASCCRRTTTTQQVPAVPSIVTVTGSCSAKAARCW